MTVRHDTDPAEGLTGYQGFNGVQGRIAALRSTRFSSSAVIAALVVAVVLLGGVLVGRIAFPTAPAPAVAADPAAPTISETEVCEHTGVPATAVC